MKKAKELFRNIKYIFRNYNCKITSNNEHCNYYKVFYFFLAKDPMSAVRTVEVASDRAQT